MGKALAFRKESSMDLPTAEHLFEKGTSLSCPYSSLELWRIIFKTDVCIQMPILLFTFFVMI